jgi:transketolase
MQLFPLKIFPSNTNFDFMRVKNLNYALSVFLFILSLVWIGIYKFNFGKAYIIHLPKKVFSHKVGIIACGPIIYEAIKAAMELEKEGIGVTVVNMPTVKPLDEQFLLRFSKTVSAIVTVEEHQVTGGLGSAVAEYLGEHQPTKVVKVGVQDRFGQSGKPKELYEEYCLTSKHIEEKLRGVVS